MERSAIAYPPSGGTAKGWFRRLTDSGHHSSDDAHQRRQKSVLTGASFLKAGMCPVWCSMFLAVGAWLAAAIPLVYATVTGLSIAGIASNKDIGAFRSRQAWYIFLAPMAVTLAVGGLYASSGVVLWSFLAPIIVLLFHGPRAAVKWLVGFVGLVVVALLVEVLELLPVVEISPLMLNVFAAMNVIVVTLIVFTAVWYYAVLLEEERAVKAQLNEQLDEKDRELENARKLGQYTLETRVGRGGMGVVFRARHALLRRPTAVKLLSVSGTDPHQLVRFEREVQLTSELNHPNVVAVYDYGRSPEGEFYYAMEFLPGTDLESLVAQDGPLPAARVIAILIDVCSALDEAHHRALIHRDIKPGNIILSRLGKRADVAKVVDFGLVKDVEEPTALTAENVVAGTPAYMSPEALVSPETVGPASDLYALGAVGFYLLTGHLLFTGRTVAEQCAHHIHTEPSKASTVSEVDVPRELDAVLLRCVQKAPSDRYRSAAAMRDALATISPARAWTQADAHAWWDRFEATRAAAAPQPQSSASRKLLSIAPRSNSMKIDDTLPAQDLYANIGS